MSIRPRDRFLTFRRDNFTCQYCGRRPPEAVLECDHVIARSKGGTDDTGNLLTAGRECNIGKGTHDGIDQDASDEAATPKFWRNLPTRLRWSYMGKCDACGIKVPEDQIEGWDSDTFCLDCAEKFTAMGMLP